MSRLYFMWTLRMTKRILYFVLDSKAQCKIQFTNEHFIYFTDLDF